MEGGTSASAPMDFVSTTGREERIAKRRARIAARVKAEKLAADAETGGGGGSGEHHFQLDGEGGGGGDGNGGGGNGGGGGADALAELAALDGQLGKGKQSILDGRRGINAVAEEGTEEVTSVRILGDDAEQTRKINEEQRRRARQERLDHEMESSARRTAAIAMKWAALAEKDVPQELLREINVQKESCAKVIEAKDALIADFNAELKRKDEEYVAALRRQRDDITKLISRMRAQTSALQKKYAEELLSIEGAFVEERNDLLEANRNEVDTALEKRRGMELQFMDLKQKRIADEHRELDGMRTQAAEDYNILKISLETEIQGMEQQLEEIRAVYQLNQEKLDYNWKVLNERDQENSATIQQQRKKLQRLQDALSNLMRKYHEADREYRQENVTLTEEYRRITESFKDLQSKFRHFEISDGKKYREMWAMHEKVVTGLVQKALQADKVITEQQLGWTWIPPSDDYFDAKRASTARANGGRGNGGGNSNNNNNNSNSQSNQDGHGSTVIQTSANTQGDGSGDGGGFHGDAGDDNGDENGDGNGADNGDGGGGGKYGKDVVRGVLGIIGDEAGFLVEEKVRDVLAPLDRDERDLVKVDAILKALGVESAEDVEELVEYFVDHRGNDNNNNGDNDDDEDEDGDGTVTLIDPSDAMAALKAFFENHREKMLETNKVRQANAQISEEDGKKKAEEEEQEFWRRMGDVVPEKHWRAWINLEREMTKYNKLLTERAELIGEVDNLQGQNDELRALLSQYLTAGVNEDLIVPPISTMQLEGGE